MKVLFTYPFLFINPHLILGSKVVQILVFKTVVKLISEYHRRPKCDFDHGCKIDPRGNSPAQINWVIKFG
jgi:hypothetical protein